MIPDPDIRFTWVQEPCRLQDARGHRLPIPSEFKFEVSVISLNCLSKFLLTLEKLVQAIISFGLDLSVVLSRTEITNYQMSEIAII